MKEANRFGLQLKIVVCIVRKSEMRIALSIKGKARMKADVLLFA